MKTAAWASIPERGSVSVIWLGMKILALFGYWVGLVICSLATVYFFLTGRVSRKASLAYLNRLHRENPDHFPRPGWRQVFLHHWNFVVNVLDRLWVWQGKSERFTFQRDGETFESEKGALLVGAHLGSVDALRGISVERRMAVNVVMYTANSPKICAFMIWMARM